MINRKRALYAFATPNGIETGLFRLGGSGLANLLFSWARCVTFSRHTGAQKVFTTWPQLKRLAWLRGDEDKRTYAKLFRPLDDEVHGSRKLFLLASLSKISEERSAHARPGQIVTFRGLRNYFIDFSSESRFLRKRLIESAAEPQLRKRVTGPNTPLFAVHVRMGDARPFSQTVASAGNMKLPLQWYVAIVKHLRRVMGESISFAVSSDGNVNDLAPLLSLPDVRLFARGDALSDLLRLGDAVALIGSCSTFSQWGAFLGQIPSIWHPRFDRNGGLGGPVEIVSSEDGLLGDSDMALLKDEIRRISRTRAQAS